MSNPARFTDYSRSQHPGSGGYPGRAPPVTSPPWGVWGAPTATPASMAADRIHHPSPYHPATDYYNRTPAVQSAGWPTNTHDTDWHNLPTKPTPQYNSRLNWANVPEDPNRFYLPVENLSIDAHHRRLKWREEILNGDPERAINDSLPNASRVVIAFIARGSPSHPHGQGKDILHFRAPTRNHLYSTAHDSRPGWHFSTSDSCPLFKEKEEDIILSAEELSTRPWTYWFPQLDVKKDLKLVRKSKPLLWDNSTVLESFLYRFVEATEEADSNAAMELAVRLGGPTFHAWRDIGEVLATPPESDIVSTALHAVFFPPSLSLVIDGLLADQEARPEQLASRALEAFYYCVQHKLSRSTFKFYPIPPPSPDQPEHVLCDKRRVWAYWTEVLAWHLSQLREDGQVSISYSLLKSLNLVRESVDDPKVATLDQLEDKMVDELAREADRLRHVTAKLIHAAAHECFSNPNFAPPEKSSDKMHIITAGTSLTIYNVITKLISNVLAGKVPADSNRKIMELKITVAESRPLMEGVVLASKLAEAVDAYIAHRDRGFKQAKRTSAAPSTVDVGNSRLNAEDQHRLIKESSEKDQLNSPAKPLTMGLSQLLASWEAKIVKKEPKVTIEVITDAAVVSTIMASGGAGVKPIILLMADRVLSNGNSVNKVGAAQMAWAGKSSGGVVLSLCRSDRIHSQHLPAPSKPNNPSEELVIGWKANITDQSLIELQRSSHVEISNPIYEDVDHNYITGYITDLGYMETRMMMECSRMKSDVEMAIWPVNALTK